MIYASSYNICSENKCQQAKKSICHSVPKTLDFSQNSFASFYQVTYDHSILGVILVDKPNGSWQNPPKFARHATSTTKKSFKKEQEIVIHQQIQIP